jgi:hypothetical protein
MTQVAHRSEIANQGSLGQSDPGPIRVKSLMAELDRLGPQRFLETHTETHLLVGPAERTLDVSTPFVPLWAVPLSGKVVLRLGRTDRADVTVDNAFVSKWHGLFIHKRGAWSYQDTGAKHGTFVNGTRLAEQQRVPLQSWDALILGRQVRALFLKPRALVEFLFDLLEDEELD